MSELVTIRVSDQITHFAAHIASRRRQPIEDILSGLLESVVHETPVENLANDEVLALSEMRLSDEQDERLSQLLACQRESQLDENGQQQLAELMHIYEQGLLRKAQALRVAVERGLHAPLQF